MRDLIASEWLKTRSLRSTWWTLGLTAVIVAGAAAVSAHADYANFPALPPADQRLHGFALADAFPLAGYLLLMVVAVASGAGAITAEYATGLIRTTTVAVPARGELLLAKAVVLTALWTVAGAVISAASFATAGFILSGRDAAASPGDADSVWAFLAAGLLGPVCALIGLGLGTLIRHGATTAVTGIAILALLPQMLSTHRPLTAALNHSTVVAAWQRLTHAYGPPTAVGDLYASFRAAWVVYAVWPVVAVLLALVAIRRRDV
jgi:ABC-2 type transport system permease protein